MTVLLTINGQNFDYPGPGPNEEWGPEATDWASAVSTGLLQKAGGLFTLLDEVDFGASYGLKSVYYKTRTSNIAAAGQFRLARADTISWRNQANSADLPLAVDSSDRLTFNGTIIQQSLSVTDTATIDLTLAADVLSASIVNGSITNAMVNSSAAIAYSKLNLIGKIVDADVNASAAIAYSKLAALTASRALVSDGSGFVSAATTSATEIGYLIGVTSAIQTQLDAKVAKSAYTAKGDILAATAAATPAVFAVGTDGQVLTANSANPTGLGWSSVLTNPMTTQGDLIVGGIAGVANRLGIGSANTLLKSNGTTSSWGLVFNANVDAAAAIAGTKIAPYFGAQDVINSGSILNGISTARANFNNGLLTPSVQVENTTNNPAFSGVRDTNDNGGSSITLAKTRGTTTGSNTVVQSGDTIGTLGFEGADGTNLVRAADIMAQVDGTPGTGDMPGRLLFRTTADGASAPTERGRIDNAGKWTIGTAAGTQFHDVNGALVPTMAGRVTNRYYNIGNADYTITSTDGYDTIASDTTMTADRTITLPSVSANKGRLITIKKNDSSSFKVIITAPSGNIDQATYNHLFGRFSYVQLESDGTNWTVLNASDYIVSAVSGTAGVSISSGTTANTVTSLTVPPGRWLAGGSVAIIGATSLTGIEFSHNSTTSYPSDGTLGGTKQRLAMASVSGTNGGTLAPREIATYDGSATRYLLASAVFGGGTVTAAGVLYLQRIG